MPGYKQKKQRLRELVKKQQEQRIKKIQQQGHNYVDSDEFKKIQKLYKYYVHLKTDYSNLLKLQNCKSFDIDEYKIYEFAEPEGAYLIKNFVDHQTQFQLGYEALNQFIFRPYRTNLDGTNGLYHENAVNQKNEELKKESQSLKKQYQEVNKNQQNIIIPEIQNQKILEGIEAQDKDLPYYFNQKIRMANLGYQYDWPHRSYPATKVPIPTTVTKLTSKAKQIYSKIKKSLFDYHGQAVIVNYYKVRDYMTGHLDDGEEDQINPIFSFCFGLSCVFLLGGPTRQKQPLAIRLDAGDLLIMSGHSRICYHGVPRIIQNSYSLYEQEQHHHFNHETEEIKLIRQKISTQIKQQKTQKQHIEHIDKRYLNGFEQIFNYYKEHRLNVNVRQVWVRKEQRVDNIQIQSDDH